MWESWGIKPTAVLGHSLGEFGAAVAAKILSPKDALSLVVTRSKLIDAKTPQAGMLVVGGDLEMTKTALEKFFGKNKIELDVAAINSTSQTVLAGNNKAVLEFKQYCDNNGIKVK
jgi:acyl transferase domain-containing protein